jgi:triacylglycerol lipase
MSPAYYARLAAQAYRDAPTIGRSDSASRMHVYGDVHVFRGTDNADSWVHDLDIECVEVPGLGRVHAGFWGALNEILPDCLKLPTPSAVVGHSLGAAMAILYGAELLQRGWRGQVYAFEPPRICADHTLETLVAAHPGMFFSYRNGRDLVTEVPPELSQPVQLLRVGRSFLPFANLTDHRIEHVIDALEQEKPGT